MTGQLSLCHRDSSCRLYQHRWERYCHWCVDHGHCVSTLSVAKIADFLFFLQSVKHLSVSSVKGFHAMLSSVFKFRPPELRDNFIIHDLIWSFELERPLCPLGPPAWDLVKVLTYAVQFLNH